MAFHTIDRNTEYLLLPPPVQAWLPEAHLTRYVVDMLEGLDLSALEGFRQFLLCGLEKVRNEWTPVCLARNEVHGRIASTICPMRTTGLLEASS